MVSEGGETSPWHGAGLFTVIVRGRGTANTSPLKCLWLRAGRVRGGLPSLCEGGRGGAGGVEALWDGTANTSPLKCLWLHPMASCHTQVVTRSLRWCQGSADTPKQSL